MTTKIGIIGDVHAYPEPLAEALEMFKKRGVERILCTGDIAGYGDQLAHCVELLIKYQCKTVVGNHDLWHLQTISADE
ncbi:MAG: metallophosphoesterase, partial [Gammaproteobacteria bacterium]|nr:metallophosphoesterase [Gammaproteobacteria bacterium]